MRCSVPPRRPSPPPSDACAARRRLPTRGAPAPPGWGRSARAHDCAEPPAAAAWPVTLSGSMEGVPVTALTLAGDMHRHSRGRGRRGSLPAVPALDWGAATALVPQGGSRACGGKRHAPPPPCARPLATASTTSTPQGSLAAQPSPAQPTSRAHSQCGQVSAGLGPRAGGAQSSHDCGSPVRAAKGLGGRRVTGALSTIGARPGPRGYAWSMPRSCDQHPLVAPASLLPSSPASPPPGPADSNRPPAPRQQHAALRPQSRCATWHTAHVAPASGHTGRSPWRGFVARPVAPLPRAHCTIYEDHAPLPPNHRRGAPGGRRPAPASPRSRPGRPGAHGPRRPRAGKVQVASLRPSTPQRAPGAWTARQRARRSAPRRCAPHRA